jgi:two-component system response regulator YesN
MRIIIADDEYLARSSLRSMLEELNLPLDFIGEASNGEEMVALVGRHLPDVAFVDIRMPKLSGLEAINSAKQVSPHTRWYILTGFPEFDYAQEAIRLGVAGYLLKPVKPGELQKILGEFSAESREQKAAQNKQFEHKLMTLSYGLASLEFEQQESILLRAHFIGGIFYLDSYLPEKTKAGRQIELCHALQASIDRCLENHNRIALFVLPGGELTTIGAWEPTRDRGAMSCVREYFKAVEQDVRNLSDKDLGITVLVSKECSTYQEFQSSLERLQSLSPLRVVSGIGRKLDIALQNEQAEKPGLLKLSKLVISLCHRFQEGNTLSYMKALQDLEKFLSRAGIGDNHLLLGAVFDFINRSINSQLVLNQDRERWLAVLQGHGERLLKGLPRDEVLRDEIPIPDIIDQVTAFIAENYMLAIGIGQLAEQFNITPNYLSTLFHRKTGITFMGYLKKVRMLKAKELLTDPNIQVQQAAEQVGYFSTRHFARLFAEQFGCLPSEYRDSFKTH